MKVIETFFKAKKDKNLRAVLVIQRDSKTFIRLCIDVKNKYTNSVESVFIETDTKISVENYQPNKQVSEICFHMSNYNYNSIQVFLNAIKKDSEVSFKVIANNTCETWSECNLVSHSLYGIVDEKIFFLSQYVGKDNLASPVR